MLTRNCEKTLLDFLGKGDFNVRVTIVEKMTSRFVQKSYVDSAWKEAFRDSIGGGILHNTTNLYLVVCQTEEITVEIQTQGIKIIDECWKYLENTNIARINITKFPTELCNVHSWIVARL